MNIRQRLDRIEQRIAANERDAGPSDRDRTLAIIMDPDLSREATEVLTAISTFEGDLDDPEGQRILARMDALTAAAEQAVTR